MILLFYTTYISVDLAQHEIYRAKVGKGGIRYKNAWFFRPSCVKKYYITVFK